MFGRDAEPSFLPPLAGSQPSSSLHELFSSGAATGSTASLRAPVHHPPARSRAPSECGAAALEAAQGAEVEGTEGAAAGRSGATSTLFVSLVQVFRSMGGAWQPAGQAGTVSHPVGARRASA